MRHRLERLRLESVRDAAGFHIRIAGRLYIHGTIAYHHGPLARGSAFGHEGFDADGVRLLEIETVAAIHLQEMSADAQPVHDGTADAHRLIGEYRHPHSRIPQAVERLPHARIEHRVIQLVFAI